MQLPPPNADTVFEQLLQDLPPNLEALARDFKAFARSRKVKTPQQMLRLVLLYSGLDQSLREVAATFTLLEEAITDQSVADRLAACGPWLKAVLAQMLGASAPTSVAVSRLIVVDASVVTEPGGATGGYRLHVGLDVVRGEVTHLLLTQTSTGESLAHFDFAPGDVVVGDRGYAHRDAVMATMRAGVGVVVRFNPETMPVEHLRGGPFDIVKDLGYQVAGSIRSFPVLMRSRSGAEVARGWVHAYRLGPAEAERARRRCRQRCSRAGRTPSERQLLLAEWVLIFCSLEPSVLGAEAVLALYRIRWQVELLFKKWKSLLNVDELRSKRGSLLGEVWIHGKLLYALLVERRARRVFGLEGMGADEQRSRTWWRVWKMVRTQVAPFITGVAFWNEAEFEACLKALSERRRARKLQHLPVTMYSRFGLDARKQARPAA